MTNGCILTVVAKEGTMIVSIRGGTKIAEIVHGIIVVKVELIVTFSIEIEDRTNGGFRKCVLCRFCIFLSLDVWRFRS
jgi:hypothetical protein